MGIVEFKDEYEDEDEDEVENPAFIAIYYASNNDTYEYSYFTILLEEKPTKKEIQKKIEDRYDGVWVADLKTLEVYSLKKIIIK